jgi:uncharacterized protein with HEPN domain
MARISFGPGAGHYRVRGGGAVHSTWSFIEKWAYEKMVHFRNFIVHRYDRIDVEILADMVNRNLTEFDQFRSEILNYVRR